MKLLKNFVFTWWQIALFKTSLIAFGILLGVTWQYFWLNIIGWVWLALIVPGIYVIYVWWKQIKT